MTSREKRVLATGVLSSWFQYRLRNLRLITQSEPEELKAQDDEGRSAEIARFLGLPEQDGIEHGVEFTRRFLGLALEAFRREKISKAKFLELARMVNVPEEAAKSLLGRAGLEEDEPSSALLPEV